MLRALGVGLLLLVVLAPGCARFQPPRVDPPPDGERTENGVAYGVTLPLDAFVGAERPAFEDLPMGVD
jgi:hypothetical protein